MSVRETPVESNLAASPFNAAMLTQGPTQLPTIIDRVRDFAMGDHGNNTAFTVILNSQWLEAKLSYQDLDRRASTIAAHLHRIGSPGDRVLIVLEPGLDYVASLFGCLYAHMIAVPVYPPSMLRLQHTLGRLQAIIDSAGASAMLSHSTIIGAAISPLWKLDRSAAVAVDQLDDGDADLYADWQFTPATPDQLAILQYTSGSTGMPRGVALTHANLSHNINALSSHYHFPGAKAVHWLPPYHDMGLIGGILLPTYEGVETVVLSPKDFISNPLRWFQAIDRYKGTSTGAPNFGYELCLRKIKLEDCQGLDLSHWKVAISGAEPVRAATLQRFAEKFAPLGFSADTFAPAMGMAESTVIMTGTPRQQEPITYQVDAAQLSQGRVQIVTPGVVARSQTLVSSGVAVPGMSVAIVDPKTCQRSAADAIGEIWARGPSIACGYWQQPELTARTFDATLADDGTTGWLRSGDLGCLVDGQLIVTGRLKELIIVGGRNHYPHDIEATVQSTSEAFKPDSGTAFAIEHDNQECLVVLQEVWRPKKFDLVERMLAALGAISENHQISPHAMLLLKSGSLPKTSSGKLRRSDCRQMYLDGHFDELLRWENGAIVTDQQCTPRQAPQNQTQQQLAAIWSELLQRENIDLNDNFFRLGGESLLVGQMIERVANTMGVQLDLSTLFANPTLAELAAQIDQSQTTSHHLQSAPMVDLTAACPLSFAQQRFWLLHELGRTDAFLHVSFGLKLPKHETIDDWQARLDRLCQRHAALRTIVTHTDEFPMQSLVSQAHCPIQRLDLQRNLSPTQIDAELALLANEPFDLNHAPLMRAYWIDNGPDSNRLQFVLHHMICDASSIEILLRDLFNESATSDDEATPYLAYAHAEQSDSASGKKLDYWEQRLKGIPDRVPIPLSTPQPIESANDDLTARLSPAVTRGIERLAQHAGVSASIVYLAAYQYALWRLSASTDLPITLPTNLRRSARWSDCVGCFINPIIYRATIDPTANFQSMLQATAQDLLADLDHADVPLQQVVARIDHPHDPGEMPLSQNMFLYQSPWATDEISARVIDQDYSHIKAYDLSVVIQADSQRQRNNTLRLATDSVTDSVTDAGGVATAIAKSDAQTAVCVAHSQRVSTSIARSFLELLVETLIHVTDNPECKVSDLPAISASDARRLRALNQTHCPPPEHTTVCQRLDSWACSHPHQAAITDDERTISYAQLQTTSDTIAQNLLRHGIAAGDRVAIVCHRSANLIASIIGIWKAHAVYVPLSAELPGERIERIIDDAQPRIVIADATNRWIDSHCEGISVLDVSQLVEPIKRQSLAYPEGDSLAYLIYTSGSTGQPKGVAVGHASVTNLLESFRKNPGFTADDTLLALTTLTFDISILEMLLPLWSGGRVRITAHSASLGSSSLTDILNNEAITWLQTTPSTLQMLRIAGWQPASELKILSGGEPLTPSLAADLLTSDATLWNVYGPTETTVWSSIARIHDDQINIGLPIDNTSVHILDASLRAVPVGCAGQLAIGGVGLAAGYWNRDELTQQSFVNIVSGEATQPDKQSGSRSVTPQRVYLTGDIARLDHVGRLHCLGRRDRQIKLRGFRIELDEIQAALMSIEGVQSAAVITTLSGANTQIVAYCVCPDIPSEQLHRELTRQLPAYMLPASIHRVNEIAKSAAGKIDYRALPRIEPERGNGQAFAPPQGPLEQAVADQWQQVLQRERVGRDESFFQLGGNSLQVAQLMARLRDTFAVKLSLRSLYDNPTVAAIADAIVLHQASQSDSEISRMLAEIESLSEDEVNRRLSE